MKKTIIIGITIFALIYVSSVFGKEKHNVVSYGDSITAMYKWQRPLNDSLHIHILNLGIGESTICRPCYKDVVLDGNNEVLIVSNNNGKIPFWQLIKAYYGRIKTKHSMSVLRYKRIDNISLSSDKRISTIPTKADTIFIMGGTNDYLNDIDDIKDSFRLMLIKIRQRCPNAHLIVMTPIISKREYTDGFINDLGLHMDNIRNHIMNECTSQDIECIDMRDAIKYDELDEMLKDDIHPNDEGGELLCKYIYNIMRQRAEISPLSKW